MSIIQKAIQHDKQCDKGRDKIEIRSTIDKKTISGCYGIDNLFANKSNKLSFIEFLDGLKDIFLAIPIRLFKIVSYVFNFIKRPAYAFGIFCISALSFIVYLCSGESVKIEKNIVAVQNAAIINTRKKTMISDIDEHLSATNSFTNNYNKTEEISENSASKNKTIAKAQERQVKIPSSRAFESKVNNFFTEHKVSDIMCLNGGCRLKVDNGVFIEHSALCEHPKIVLESSTDEDIIFSDGEGSYCAMKIDSLFR